MSGPGIHDVVIAWWNTSLARVVGRRRTIEHDRIPIARETIDEISQVAHALFLGEIAPELAQEVTPQGKKWEWGGDGVSRLGDIGCILSPDVFELAGRPTPISDAEDGTTLDARVVRFDLTAGFVPVALFGVHSHSRPGDRGGELRRRVASMLHASVTQTRRDTPHVIVAGDFNDEPFDQSVSETLRSSRDARLAAKDDRLLYNPCWRFMHDGDANAEHGLVGTARGRDRETRWRAFDQILMSAAWLDPEPPRFSGTCVVLQPRALMTREGRPIREPFDHLPVAARFLLDRSEVPHVER